MYCNLEHKQMVENRGDAYEYLGSYKCGEIAIDGKCLKKGKQTYIKVKCPYCGKKYYVSLINFTKKKVKCTYCCNSYEKSFAYHIQQELSEDLNKYWDWEKNTVNPYHIYKSSNKTKVWIKCTKTDYHESNLISPANFVRGDRCPYCSTRRGKVHPRDSFAQWGIDNIDKDFLTKYWSNKNDELGINPWKLTPHSTNKIYIYCQEKDYHNDDGGYLTTCDRFYQGNRCPYCVNQKIHPKDSFGALYPSKAKHWSEKNDKSPFEVAPKTDDKYKFICQECGEEFDRSLLNLNKNNTGVICRNCVSSQLEQETSKILQKYNNEYEREKEFEKLIGKGNKPLRYDFYLQDYNLLIECQGIQHKEWQKTWITKKDFERQLEHDRRKKQYAIDYKINFLEIWYYDIDNIEEILTKQLNL